MEAETSQKGNEKTSTSLFIRNVPEEATKEKLETFLSDIGPIKWCFLVNDKETKKNRGIAYAQFAMKEDSDRAIQELQTQKFLGKHLLVSYAKAKKKDESRVGKKGKKGKDEENQETNENENENENEENEEKEEKIEKDNSEKKTTEKQPKQKLGSRIILRNLDFSCNEKHIRKAFSKFGEITEINLPKHDKNPNMIKGFGFLKFSKRDEAIKAVNDGNGMKLNGRQIVVDLSLPKNDFETLREKIANEEKEEEEEENSEEESGDDSDEEDEEDEDDEDEEEDEDEDEVESGDEEDEEDEEDYDEDDDEDDEDDEDDDEEEEHKPDLHENKTIFIMNLLFETTEAEIKEKFEQFGKVLYCRIVYNHAGLPKGTAFLKFADSSSAQEAIKAGAYGMLQTKVVGNRKFQSVVQDNTRSGITLGGRVLAVVQAVEKDKLTQITDERKKNDLKDSKNDKRNLYLAREGFIDPKSEAGKKLSQNDLNKREKAEQEKKKKLKNPNFFVSKTRLSIRNIPLTVTDKQLKDIFATAVATRFKDESSPELEMENGKKRVQIKQVKIERSKDRVDTDGTPRSKGFGFVEFSEHAHALAALRQVNNNPSYFGNRRPIVEFSIENVLMLKKRNEKLTKLKSSQKSQEDEPKLTAREKKIQQFKKRREKRKERKKLKFEKENEESQDSKPEKPSKLENKKKDNKNKGTNEKKEMNQKEGNKSKKFKQQEEKNQEAPHGKKSQRHFEKQQQQIPKKRKRTEDDNFQKLLNAHKKKLFKSEGGSNELDKWIV